MQKQSRPRGVTIIAILIIIAGILSLLLGIGLVVIGPFLMNGLQTTSSNLGSQIEPQIFGIIFLVFGAISLALGVANLVMAYGLWKGKGWAWTISIIVLLIGIAIDIISVSITSAAGVFSNTGSNLLGDIVSSIVSIGISAFIVYYLYRPHVKAYFGKTIPMPST
jgi:glucan phosphoethanolaminetransferase (alkaline phosphatase superfamily)